MMLRQMLKLTLAIFLTINLGRAMAANVEVKISNFTFAPAEVTVHSGDTVTFKNEDDIPHSVVAKDGTFKLKVMDTNETGVVTFAKAGEFSYFCGLHPHMLGKVIVAP